MTTIATNYLTTSPFWERLRTPFSFVSNKSYYSVVCKHYPHMEPGTDSRSVKAVEHAMAIIDALQQHSGLTLTEIANAVGLSPSSVYTQLSTLQQQGYVEKSEKVYALSPQFITIGERVRHQQPLYRAGKGAIQQLADETGEAAHLVSEFTGRLLPLYEVFGARAIGVEYHAKKREQLIRHLHCTASGKAYLANLSEERVREIIGQHGLLRKTPNTITDPDELFEELETVSKQGYAIADEEQMVGIRAIGAPIMRVDGSVAGALSLSGPTSRLKGDRLYNDLRESVLKASNMAEISLNSRDEDE